MRLACLLLISSLLTSAPASEGEFVILLSGIPLEVAQGVTLGEPVTDAAGKGTAGRVCAVQILPHREEVYCEKEDALVPVPLPGKADLYLTVRGAFSNKSGILHAGTLPLRRGATVYLHLPHLCGEGVLLEVLL